MNSLSQYVTLRLLFLASIIFLLSSSALAGETGSITLKSGTSYDNVEFTVDRQYKVIKLEKDGWKKSVSFSDIEAIIDKDGNDITSGVLGDYHKRTDETWLSERSEVIRKARARVWEISFQLNGNYSFPVGDYYEGIDPGPGFGGDLRMSLTHQIALRATISKSGMRAADDFYLVSLDPDISILNQEYTISTVRYTVAGEYYHLFDKEKKDLSMFYAYSGLGVAVHSSTAKMTFRQNSTGLEYPVSEKDTQSKFVITLGIGIVKMFARNTGLNFSADYQLVHVGNRPSDFHGDEMVYASIFDLEIGIATIF